MRKKLTKILYQDEHVSIVNQLPSHVEFWQFWKRKDKSEYVIVIDDGQIVAVFHKYRVVTNEMCLLARMLPENYWEAYERIQ